jgi:type I restriction enzyme S subunit
MATNQGCKGLVPRECLDHKFLYYYLSSIVDLLNSLGTGATFKELSGAKLKDVPIAIPSIAEQRRIVAILDQAFESIPIARANAEKNLQNTHELFDAFLAALLRPGNAGWYERALEQVVEEHCSLSYGIVQPGDDSPGGLPIVRPVDLTTRIVGLDGLKRIRREAAESYRRTELRGGELLLCVRGTTGTVAMASPELKGANVTRGIVPVAFNSALLDPEFGYYLMISAAVQEQIQAKTYGAALMQINIRDLRIIRLAFPALSEQRVIKKKLDGMFAETQRLESIYQRKLATLDELKQSLLHQAFSGAL